MGSFTELHDLVEDVQRANPRDPTEQQMLLQRILAYRDMLTQASSQELATYLETAAMLTDHLAQMGGLGPEDIQAMVARLVTFVDTAFSQAALPGTHPSTRQEFQISAPAVDDPSSGGGGNGLTLKMGGGMELSSDNMFGEILIQLRFATPEQVSQGLKLQHAAGIRLGEALVQNGVLTFDQVQQAISVQKKLRRGS